MRELQALLLEPEPGCEDLFLGSRGSTSISPGATLRLDGFANSFYERHWRDFADLQTLALDLTTSGPCAVRLVRRIAGGGESKVAEARVQGQCARSTLNVALSELPVADAVLHLEIEAGDAPVQLHEGDWATHDPARNAVRLAIVICSFNREAMLVDTLRRIAPAVAQNADVAALFVVHQGARDLSVLDAYAALQPESFAGKLRLIQQGNLGGTGGFTRGMLAALETRASDVLLLDDDIRILPQMLDRLTALLASLKAPTTIGGQMLDLHRPTQLHASHEQVDFPKLRLRNPCKGVDLAAPHAADRFAGRQSSDYAAWWFCCVPAATCRTVGLPLPMFIRHDDVEYGVRTRAAGAALVVMPGVFVWHEPFAAKFTPTYVYYERRNCMIAAALHQPLSPWRLAAHHAREVWMALLSHRYDYCGALCRAVEDYLRGPDFVFAGIAQRHRTLAAEQARLTLLTMMHLRGRTRSGRASAHSRVAAARRGLVVEAVRTSAALLWRGRRAAAAYRAGAATYASAEHWRGQFTLPSHAAPPP